MAAPQFKSRQTGYEKQRKEENAYLPRDCIPLTPLTLLQLKSIHVRWGCSFYGVVSLFICHELRSITVLVYVRGERTAIPVQGLMVPEDRGIPDFKMMGTWGWSGCQTYAPATFTLRKYSWYTFRLEG